MLEKNKTRYNDIHVAEEITSLTLSRMAVLRWEKFMLIVIITGAFNTSEYLVTPKNTSEIMDESIHIKNQAILLRGFDV